MLLTQTDGQLKSIREGGFSLQQHGEADITHSGKRWEATTRRRRLLLQRAGQAGHALLLPPGERPAGSFHQQLEQELVVQIRLVGLQELQNGGAQAEMKLGTERGRDGERLQ